MTHLSQSHRQHGKIIWSFSETLWTIRISSGEAYEKKATNHSNLLPQRNFPDHSVSLKVFFFLGSNKRLTLPHLSSAEVPLALALSPALVSVISWPWSTTRSKPVQENELAETLKELLTSAAAQGKLALECVNICTEKLKVHHSGEELLPMTDLRKPKEID